MQVWVLPCFFITFLALEASEKRRKANRRTHGAMPCVAVFFHPDYTVGSGIGPDLLTLGQAEPAS